MKRIHGVWYYMGREYGSLHAAMLAAKEVLLTVLAVREVLTLHLCYFTLLEEKDLMSNYD